jgi:hypothetical protein
MKTTTKNATFSRRFENTVYGSLAVLTVKVAALLLNAVFSGPMIV